MAEKYTSLIELINTNPDVAEFGTSENAPSDEWIAAAQERLDVTFPPSYIWWLKNYGGGEIYGNEIFSVYEINFDDVVGGDIVYMNEHNREDPDSPKTELLIMQDDLGGEFYINLTEVNAAGESPVYSSASGAVFAADFADFLKKQIEQTHY